MTEWSNRFLILMGAAGIFITGALSYTTLNKLDIPCGGHLGCAIVQDSPFAFFPTGDGIPVAYIGLFGYIVLFGIALVRSMVTGQTHRQLSILGFAMSAIGLVFSLWLTYASIGILGQKCIWCLSSLGVIVLTTIGHAALLQGDVPEKADLRIGWFTGGAAFAVAMVALLVRMQDLNDAIKLGDIMLNKEVAMEQAQPAPNKMTDAPGAQVMLLEYADFNCPSCRNNYPEVKKALAKYGNKVRFAFRSLPLFDKPGHETSLDAAILAEFAADKGVFWRFVDTMFLPENKERIKDKDGLIAAAVEAGLDRDEILALYVQDEDGNAPVDKYIVRVEDDIKMAAKLGVEQTPTFILYAEGQSPTVVRPTGIQDVLDSSPYRELVR